MTAARLGVIVGLVAMYLLSTGLCQLPESSSTSFACFGSVDEGQLQPSCQLQSAVIAIQSIYAGVKRTSDNCTLSGEPACCTRNVTTDCRLPVPQSSSLYYQDCSGRQTCTNGVQRYPYNGECGAMSDVEYDRFSNYLTMDYYCLPVDTRISQMCTTVNQTTAADAAVYVWSPGYPAATVPGPNCTCSLETEDCEARIQVFTVHVDLGANISDCQQTLEVIDGNGARLMSWTCDNNSNHYTITATDAAATYIQLVFTTMAGTSAGNYFWIGFQSTSGTDGLRLRCPAEPQTKCPQTTTSTTTTPTTTLETTTLPTTSSTATTTQPTTSTTATTTTQLTTSTTATTATSQPTTTTIITTPPPTTTTAIPTTPPTTTMTTSSSKTNEDTRVEYYRDDTNIIIAVSVCSAALIVTISAVVVSYVYCCRKHRQGPDEEKKSSTHDKQTDTEDIGTRTTGHYQKFSTDDRPPDKVWKAATDKVDIGTLTTCNCKKFLQLPSKSTQTKSCVNFITPIDIVTRNIDTDKKHELDITDNNVNEPTNTGYMAEREVVTKPPRTDNATDQNQRFKLLKILTDKRVETSKEEDRKSLSDMVPVATVIPTNKRNINTNEGTRNDDVDKVKTLVKEGVRKDSSVTQTDGQKKIARETTLKQNKITGVVTLPPINPSRTPDTNFKEKAITTNAKSEGDVSLTPSNGTSATLTSEYSDETSTRSQDNNRRKMAIQETYKKMDGHGDDSDDVKDTEIIKAELSEFLSASKPVKEKQVLRKETEIVIESDVLHSVKYDQMFRTVANAFYDIERSPKRRKKRKLKKRVT